MQVYAALVDPDADFLVVKKREFNNWWKLKGDAKQGGMPHLVNQAGQYAFPGGKAESSSYEGDAKREFEEETGLSFPLATLYQIYKRGSQYRLFVFKVPTGLAGIAAAIRHGAAPNPANSYAPVNIRIEDWELADAEMVPLAMLDAYLGVAHAVSGNAAHAISQLPAENFSQSIDWYGEMAQALQNSFSTGSGVITI